MKSFKDYDWPRLLSINPDPDISEELLDSFYNPVFERTKIYRRISGYFSSSSLNYLCRGITELINNDGKMLMIIGNSLSQKDQEAIEKGLFNPESYMKATWDSMIIESESNVELRDSFEALSWLLANDRLEMKIAINMDEDGRLLSSEESKFHQKIALYEDHDGNFLLSLGSLNETGAGYQNNRETMSIQRGWDEGMNETVNECLSEFGTLWLDKDNYSRTFDLPECIKDKLFEMVPEKKPVRKSRKRSSKSLRPYQREAIEFWVDNNYSCIFNMATGTGKTFTAVAACHEKTPDKGCIMIVVPQIEIAMQWKNTCTNVFGDDINILVCTSHNGDWKKKIPIFMSSSRVERCILIVTKNTFSKNYFYDKISGYLKSMTLVIDEVHEIGADKARNQLSNLESIPRRLGLSATPKRMRDSIGNEAISSYFGNATYEYSMHRAIYPGLGEEQYLCQYNYYLHFSVLTEDEYDEHHQLSLKILRFGNDVEKIPESKRKIYDSLCRERANIIKSSSDRLNTFKEIIDKYDDTFKKCIIYCNSVKESKLISKILNEKGCVAAEYHSNVTQRDAILDTYVKSDFIKYLVSIGCLDQGVDIPCCDSAIILSSTGNDRQYIQRRGRILRLYKGKEIANIHDVLVSPYNIDDIIRSKVILDSEEKNIIRKQLRRVNIFLEDARNELESEELLFNLERRVDE